MASLLCVVVTLAILSLIGCSAPARFQGTDLGATPAPDFRLTDQNGRAVSLSDLRGRPVVLTFLYTRCTDACPLIATKLAAVCEALGDEAGKVNFIAVSISPEDDTPASIAAFSFKTGMAGRWRYLNGTRAELEPVWKAYYLAIATPPPPETQLNHTARLVLIDRAGRQRVNFAPDFSPNDLVSDLRILLSE